MGFLILLLKKWVIFKVLMFSGRSPDVWWLPGEAADSCLVWSSGSWTKSHSLTRARRSHISFPTSQGTFLLGGYTNPQTSDLLKEDGTVVPGFDLKYRTE